jgi:hypothetical protein
MATLEQSGDTVVFLQEAFNVMCQCSNFFKAPSVVSQVTVMASAARSQVMAEEGEAMRKA